MNKEEQHALIGQMNETCLRTKTLENAKKATAFARVNRLRATADKVEAEERKLEKATKEELITFWMKKLAVVKANNLALYNKQIREWQDLAKACKEEQHPHPIPLNP